MEHLEAGAAPRPLWRRIVDFPLVAMLIAMVVVIACFTAAVLIGKATLPIPGFTMNMKFDLIAIPLMLIAYLLLIRRLGVKPRHL